MRRSRGSVAVYTLLVCTIVVTATLGVAGVSMQNMTRARQDRLAWEAFQAAQAGLELGVARQYAEIGVVRSQFVALAEDRSVDIQSIAPGATLAIDVAPQSGGRSAYVTSTVTYQNRRRSVRSLVSFKNVGIWNNAIFAGTGAAGQAINGNVDIRGSVHILGEGEAYTDLNGNGVYDPAESFTDRNRNRVWDPGEPFVDRNSDGVWNSAEPYNDTNGNGEYDEPLTNTDLNSTLSGNAHVGNHYSGMPATLEAIIPAAPRINGIETLFAELRCKHGRVSVNGSATVGASGSIDGGTSKGTLDGTFVSDGFTGNQGSSSVFSDNGTSNAYDLGYLNIDFPIISGIGAQQYKDAAGNNWTTHETYLDARALTVPVASITSTTPAFSYGPDSYGNKISFTPATKTSGAVLNVTGIIKFANNLQIGAKDSIAYDGVGTLYCTGSMSIDGNLLPVAGKTFPTQAVMGFIAKQNLNLATGNGSSQLSLAGAFYAQGRITSAKQNQVLGTFVSNFFDMGTNVPNIYQVPELANNLPPGMPGKEALIALTMTTWRTRAP